MAIATVNPATGETLKVFTPLTDHQISQKISLAQQAFEQYKTTSYPERQALLIKAATILESNATKYAQLMTLEMGKTITSSLAEIEKCALVCRYYAQEGAAFLADQEIATDASLSLIRYQPLGVILAVMPWNFPFWQVFRFAAPTLMAGNVGLLKHASNVPQCALAIEEILLEAGFAEGVFQTLLIEGARVATVLQDEIVKAATLTGSEAAGASLAALAGQLIKKTVLELGGSDPFIVLESANLETAVESAVASRMLNNGQSCIAAKRFIVQDSIRADFITKLRQKYKALKIGDPTLSETQIGPLATESILLEIEHQVAKAVSQGAQIITGGQRIANSSGYYYQPTILTGLKSDSPIAQEEFFGPVALVFGAANLEEAISQANATPFGLAASGWTNDPQEQEKLCNKIEAGAVFINGIVKSDPRLPFGGLKRSGYGRELGKQGIQEFVNIKTIWIK